MREITMQDTQKDHEISVLAANSIFFIGVFMLFTLNFLMHRMHFEWEMLGISTFLMQIAFFLMPAFLYLIIKRKNLRYVLRLNKLSLGNTLLVIAITIFAVPTISAINYMIYAIVNALGRPLPNPLPVIDNMYSLVIGIVIIAIAPAICEEVMARGVIMRGYERFGNKTAWAISAILFSIMHRNIQSVVPIFLIGLLLAYIVYRTNSIWAGVVAHFINNAVAIALLYVARKMQQILGMSEEQIDQAATLETDIFTIIIVIGAFIFCLTAVIGFMALLIQNTKKINHNNVYRSISKPKAPFTHYIPLIIGLFLIVLDFVWQVQYILG